MGALYDMTAQDRQLDADTRAIASPCPACQAPSGERCHFIAQVDRAKWVHLSRGLAFWRHR